MKSVDNLKYAKRLSEEIKQQIVELYDGSNRKSLAKKFDVSPQCISYTCKKVGLKSKTSLELSTKHFLDKNYFEDVNTEEKAYWLGFLAADGNVFWSKTKRSGGIKIELSANDLNHLEKLKNNLNSSHTILILNFNIVGASFCFLQKIQDTLVKNCNVSKNKITKNSDNCYRLFYSGRKMIRRIRNYLYKDATIFLERKKEKFNKI